MEKFFSGRVKLNTLLMLIVGALSFSISYKIFKHFFKPATIIATLSKDAYPCVVIGGGAGGLTSAIYLTQLGCKTLVICGPNPGGALRNTKSVQNWPGETEIQGQVLVNKLANHAVSCGATMLNQNVTAVDFSTWPFSITIAENKKITALSCIIASGATANKLNVEGESEFWGQGVTNCAICDGPMFKNHTVAIVGGGDSALTEVDLLTPIVKKIYLLVRSDKLRAQGPKVAKLQNNPKVEILYNTTVEKIVGDEKGVSNLIIKTAGKEKLLTVSGLFLAIGSKPNTQLFKNELSLDKNNFIQLKADQATSVDGVFAVGDVCDEKYRQAITAAGSGCKAALQALEFLTQKNINLEGYAHSTPDASKNVSTAEKAKLNAASDDQIELELERENQRIDAEEIVELELEEAAENIRELTSVAQLTQLQKQTGLPLVLDIYAPWCMPCQFMHPVFEELAIEFKDKINFTKVNADDAPQMLQDYGVRGVPTFIFFDKEGKQVERATGQMSKEDLIEILNKLL